MFHTSAISILLKLSAVAVLGAAWACRTYWSDLPSSAVFTLVFAGFVSGSFLTASYMLTRYRRELTPEVK